MAIYRRIYKQGNSFVLTLPSWMLDELELKVGDSMLMRLDKPSRAVVLYGTPADEVLKDRYAKKGVERTG